MDKYFYDLMRDYSRKLNTEYTEDQVSDYFAFEKSLQDRVNSGENVNFEAEVLKSSDNIKNIYGLMSNFQDAIKNTYLEHNDCLYHISNIPPEKLTNGTFTPSKNIVDCFGFERGDFFFASSQAPCKDNFYIARTPEAGSFKRNDLFVYGGNNINLSLGENGENRIELKNSNYCYKLNPDSFLPVVSLQRNGNGSYSLAFSDEWKSRESFNISNKNEVLGIDTIKDVSVILEGHRVYQVPDKDDFRAICKASESEMEDILEKLHNDGKIQNLNTDISNEVTVGVINKDIFKDFKNDTSFNKVAEKFVDIKNTKDKDNNKTYNLKLFDEKENVKNNKIDYESEFELFN